jgi:flagellar biosynthesis protein
MDKRKKMRTATALRYALGDPGLPEVVANGRGIVAEKILQIAKENGIPIREDGDLAEILASLDIGTEIPPEAIVAVAEIMARIYRLNAKKAE